jgi:YHS domain-containing protein
MNSQQVTKLTLMSVSLAMLLLTGLGGLLSIGKSQMINVAIKGYDTVSYFTTCKAVKGSELFPFQWHGMIWYFSTKENMDLFATSPEKYAPQYDGYCAWAMSEGRKSQTNPEVWKIVSGKLYLNCSMEAYNKWSRDIPGNIKKADTNWLTFLGSN